MLRFYSYKNVISFVNCEKNILSIIINTYQLILSAKNFVHFFSHIVLLIIYSCYAQYCLYVFQLSQKAKKYICRALNLLRVEGRKVESRQDHISLFFELYHSSLSLITTVISTEFVALAIFVCLFQNRYMQKNVLGDLYFTSIHDFISFHLSQKRTSQCKCRITQCRVE